MTEKRYENIGLHIIDGYIRRSDGVHLYVPPEIVTELNNLSEENEQLKEELGSFEQVSFTDLCDGSRTVLYMKKENVGDSE